MEKREWTDKDQARYEAGFDDAESGKICSSDDQAYQTGYRVYKKMQEALQED